MALDPEEQSEGAQIQSPLNRVLPSLSLLCPRSPNYSEDSRSQIWNDQKHPRPPNQAAGVSGRHCPSHLGPSLQSTRTRSSSANFCYAFFSPPPPSPSKSARLTLFSAFGLHSFPLTQTFLHFLSLWSYSLCGALQQVEVSDNWDNSKLSRMVHS